MKTLLKKTSSIIVVAAVGVSMVANLVREMENEIRIVTALIGIVAIGVVSTLNLYWHGIRRDNPGDIHDDERTTAIFDKSARNAFMVTWLTLFILVSFGSFTAGSLLIVVGSGLAVFITSYYLYLFMLKGT